MMTGIDSNRFLDPLGKRLMKAWAGRQRFDGIPWTPLPRPLSDCRVALLSSAAIALKEDQPFDQAGEVKNPWWGDPSFRVLPADTRTQDVNLYHLHVDTRPAEQDLNCVMPIERLTELAQSGVIGKVARSHYSIMGYILDETELLAETAPRIVAQLKEERVDVVLLVPV